MAGELVLPKGIFTRRNHDVAVRKPMEELLSKQTDTYNASRFKYEQKIYPDTSEARKIAVACSTCFPNHVCHLDEEVKISGIRNLFHIYTNNNNQSLFVRRLSDLSYVWETASSSEKRVPVLNRKEILKDAINSLGLNQTPEQLKEVQTAVLDLILPYTSIGKLWIFRLVGWLLRKFFGKVSGAVCVHEGEVELLDRAHLTDLPVIYAPLNRSDLDPFVLYFTLQSLGLPTPYFLSTASQRYWGRFIGGLGFWPKQYETKSTESKHSRNTLSTACFRNVLIKHGSISLHLEQQRSRSGKPSVELFGVEFISQLFDCWIKNEVEDAYIVPLDISYEKLPEHYDEPQFLKMASNVSIFKKMVKYYRRHKLGLVRVNFGQPFTLREFQACAKTNAKYNDFLKDSYRETLTTNYAKIHPCADLRWDTSLNPTLSCSLSSMYDLFVDDDEQENNEKYAFVDSLVFHAAYASAYCTTPMSTHFMAFILLKKFRKSGASLLQLVREVRKLQLWFTSYGKDVGFSGDVEKVVLHALNMLGPDTVKFVIGADGVMKFVPILSSDSVQRLGYYANSIFHFLTMESVVAVAVLAIIGNKLKIAKEFDVDQLRISDEVLTLKVLQVCESFGSEFFLYAPCQTPGAAIRKTYEMLNDKELIQSLLDETVRRTRRMYESELYDEHSEDEDVAVSNKEGVFVPYEYKISNSNEAYTTLCFLRDLFIPYIEIYAEIILELECLINPTQESKKFLSNIQFMENTLLKLKKKFSVEDYGELLTLDILKTACLAFESYAIIYYSLDKPTQRYMIHLSQEYDCKDKIADLSNKMLHFVTF